MSWVMLFIALILGIWVGNAFSNNYTKGLLERYFKQRRVRDEM